MKVSKIATYEAGVSADSCYKEINQLIQLNLDNGTLPYFSDIPLPQDTNVINGRHFADINQQNVELKAASIGTNRSLWIYGADAEFIGLELKDTNPEEFKASQRKNKNFNCDPILVYANIKERFTSDIGSQKRVNVAREGLSVDAQYAYLLEQFTEKSLKHALSLGNLEKALGSGITSVQNRSALIARQILKNIQNYDTGIIDIEYRTLIRNNIRQNCDKKSAAFKEASETYQKYMAPYTPEQKAIFNIFRKHYANQITGEKIATATRQEKITLTDALTKILDEMNKDSKKQNMLSKTLFEAMAFTDRLSHYGFSFQPVFCEIEAQNGVINRIGVTAPKAAARLREQGRGVSSIINEKTRQQILRNSRNHGNSMEGR